MKKDLKGLSSVDWEINGEQATLSWSCSGGHSCSWAKAPWSSLPKEYVGGYRSQISSE